MKASLYLKDKIIEIFIFLLTIIIITLFFFAYKMPISLIIITIIIINVLFITCFMIDYHKKKAFYDFYLLTLNRLDQKYLILETLTKPSFYEGQILYDSLYEINKSMLEKINSYKENVNDFKEYIETWIHEVKIPIASMELMHFNHQDKLSKSLKEEIDRLDDYTEKVLYYVRSENAEKDYLIKKVNLNKIIHNVLIKNKNILLENKIDVITDNKSAFVFSDAKWLEFIINQILSNSIKYHSKENPYIKISITKEDNLVFLNIYDNGIGISKKDLPRIFDKTFTGTNGHQNSKSTGMGLYIVKNLINKLGHQISITSKEHGYTKVTITFALNDYYHL